MKASSVVDIQSFADYLDAIPAELASWRAGEAGWYPLLAWLNTHPTIVTAAAVAKDGVPWGVWTTTRQHYNQVGVAIMWMERHLIGPARRPPSERGRLQLFDLAGRYWVLRNFLAEVYQGVRRFELQGRMVVLPFVGDTRLDALDRAFNLVDDLDAMNQEPPRPDARYRPWMAADGKNTTWSAVPEWARVTYRALAAHVVGRTPSYLPLDLDFGPFRMGDAVAVLTELLASAMHLHTCTVYGCVNPAIVVPVVPVAALVSDLSQATGVSAARVAHVIDLLTLELARCPDPCLTPLIPFKDDTVLPMSSLIIPSAPVRNFTALLKLDPSTFGSAGKALGALGARTTAATLQQRLTGVRVETGIKVFRTSGQLAGDLDVVVCDPIRRTLLIFEVLWRIGPDGSSQVAETERAAAAKRVQVARLRGEIASGESLPRWPTQWPALDGFHTAWFVLTPETLPVVPHAAGDVIVRSHQLLARMLKRGATTADLIALLEDPPIPPTANARGWTRMQYGSLIIEVDAAA